MQFDTLQEGQFQAELRHSLVLLHQIVLREDAGTFGQFLQSEVPGGLHDLAGLVLSKVQNSRGIRACFGKHQRTPVLYYLDIDLAQVRASL
jgi:hypothetical protein